MGDLPFPGCNRRAARCESDHIEPWNGHNTIAANLQPQCLRHHHLKHETVWRDPGGITHWTSPGGRRYAKPPDDRPPPNP